MSSKVGSITESDHNKKREMVLPFVPLSIIFDNIRYAVDMPPEMQAQGQAQDRLELLKGVSGTFRPGVLTALMGYRLACGACKEPYLRSLSLQKKHWETNTPTAWYNLHASCLITKNTYTRGEMDKGDGSNLLSSCQAMYMINGDIDVYNIYAPICLTDLSNASAATGPSFGLFVHGLKITAKELQRLPPDFVGLARINTKENIIVKSLNGNEMQMALHSSAATIVTTHIHVANYRGLSSVGKDPVCFPWEKINRYHIDFEVDPALVDLDEVVELTGPADPRTAWLSAL
nr:pleiotropic drug resistance protein 1-like [Tanacetum cinerariifolium]